MVKNTIAVVVGCVYVALSAWLVRHEGKVYREGLGQSRLAEAAALPPVGERNEATEQAPGVDVTPTQPAPSARTAETRDKIATVAPAGTPARPASPGPSAPTGAGAKPVTQAAPDKPAGPPAREDLLAKLDPFWLQPELTKKRDLSNLSPPDEMRLGGELNGLILRFNQRVPSGPWLERVETLARPILANRARKEIQYTFTILDSEAVNAFSHLGGYVYLSRGLFSFLGEDEDAALQFVLCMRSPTLIAGT